jgi:hypothetical protein
MEPSRSPTPRIRPAFVDRQSALLFCVLLTGLFVFPLVNQRIFPHWRYPSAGLHVGPGDRAFFEQACAPAAGKVDLILVGDSYVRNGLEPNLLESILTAELHRPIRVVTIAFRHRGEEVLYLGLRICLAAQRPALVIMDMPYYDADEPHIWAYRLLKTDEGPDFYSGLAPRHRLELYAQTLLGLPRTLLNALRVPEAVQFASDYRGNTLSTERLDHQPFVLGDPQPRHAFTAADSLYTDAVRSHWDFQDRQLMPYGQAYFDKSRALLAAKQVPLAIIDVPRWLDRHDDKVKQRLFWPRYWPSIKLLGLAPPLLFEGLSEAEIAALYADIVHMNLNGARFFTHAVAPGIVALMKESLHAN